MWTHGICVCCALMPAKASAELTEHLPTEEAFCLKGHEGPVLAVRFNSTGTYCLSCGKVRWLILLALDSVNVVATDAATPDGMWRCAGPNYTLVEPPPWHSYKDISRSGLCYCTL